MRMTDFFTASIGRKQVLSALGVGMVGWSLLHLAGNLAVVAGETTFNAYAAAIAASPVLWLQRLVFWALFVGHIVLVTVVVHRSRRARPHRYHHPLQATAPSSSTWVRVLGVLFGGFVVWHVAHIYGVGHVDFRADNPHHNLVVGLSVPAVAVLYVVGAVLFALHLQHASRAVLSTWGATRPWARGPLQKSLRVLPFVFGLGFTFVVAWSWAVRG